MSGCEKMQIHSTRACVGYSGQETLVLEGAGILLHHQTSMLMISILQVYGLFKGLFSTHVPS